MIKSMIKAHPTENRMPRQAAGLIRPREPDRSTHPNRQTTPSADFIACLIGQFG
jgi:hypothetical protein